MEFLRTLQRMMTTAARVKKQSKISQIFHFFGGWSKRALSMVSFLTFFSMLLAVTFTSREGLCATTVVDSVAAAEAHEPIVVIGVVAPLPKYRESESRAASLVEMAPEKVPFVVDTFTEDFIRERNATDLDYLIALQPGIYQGGKTVMARHAGSYTIRGFSGAEVKLNGMPLTGGIGTFFDPSLLEGVDIIKGPVGGAYGSQSNGGTDALGASGSILLRTKRPVFDEDFYSFSTRGSYSKASGRRLKFTADINQRATEDEALAIRVPLAYEWRDPGWAPTEAKEGQTFSAAPSIAYCVTERLTVGADLFYQYSDQPAYQGVRIKDGRPVGGMDWDDTFTRPEDRMIFQTHSMSLYAEGELTDYLETRTQFSFLQSQNRYHYRGPNSGHSNAYDYGFNWEDTTSISGGRYEYAEGDRLTRSYYAGESLIFKFATGEVEHQLLIGVDALLKENQGWSYFGTPNYTPEKTRSSKIGFTAQTLTEYRGWSLLAGARADFHNSVKHTHTWTLSPRAGVSYDLFEEGKVILFANLSLTKTPNGNCKQYNPSQQPGEPDRYLTGTWSALQKEAGVRFNLVGSTWLTASVFHIDQKDAPTQFGRTEYYTEEGENSSKGFELSFSGDLTEHWSIYAAYAYLNYTNEVTGVSFDRFPPHAFSLWTSYKAKWFYDAVFGLGMRWRDGWEMTFRGAQADAMYSVDDLLTVDASIEFPLSEKFSLGLSLRNIFNTRGVESARNLQAFANDGRTLELTLNATF